MCVFRPFLFRELTWRNSDVASFSLRISDWTLQWRGLKNLKKQGCLGPQNDAMFEGSIFLGSVFGMSPMFF